MKNNVIYLSFLVLRCPYLFSAQHASIACQSVDNNQVVIYHLPFAGQGST